MQVPTQLVLRGLISGATLLLLCGCGSDSAPKAASGGRVASVQSSHAVESSSPITPLPKLAASNDLKNDSDEEAADKNSVEIPKTATADYQPPFPDRINLFVAPKRERNNMLSNQDGESVQLLGFVNVVGHRVVLSIDGTVFPVAEGDTEAGIEVISIQPPMVVLQRGRERWQAALDN